MENHQQSQQTKKKEAEQTKECPKCKEKVKLKAKKCKHCGADLRNIVARNPVLFGLIFIIFLGLMFIVNKGGEQKNPTSVFKDNELRTHGDPEQREIDKKEDDPFMYLQGFDYNSKNNNIYTLTPIGGKDYSVTMMISDKDFNIHNESYPLESSTKTIAETQVKIGFAEEFKLNDIIVRNAHESLAFDFQLDNKYYSGEISNLKAEPSKVMLLEILEKLVNSVKRAK